MNTAKTNCNCNCNCNDDYLPPVYPGNGCDCDCGDIPLPPPRPLPPIHGCHKPPTGCNHHTRNYGLPLWKASDVTSWLMQMNGAMIRIDEVLHDLALRTGINGLPDDVISTVQRLSQDVEVLKCTVSDVTNKSANIELLMQNMNTQFGAMQTDLSSMQLSITNLDTRIMTIDSSNTQNKNNITLLKSDLNMLSDTVKNISSNFQQYQLATNATLAEHEVAIKNMQDEITNAMWGTLFVDSGETDGNFTTENITVSENSTNIVSISESQRSNGISIRVRNMSENVGAMYFRTPNKLLLTTSNTSIGEFSIFITMPDNIRIKGTNVLNPIQRGVVEVVVDNVAEMIQCYLSPKYDNSGNLSGINVGLNSGGLLNISTWNGKEIKIGQIDGIFFATYEIIE